MKRFKKRTIALVLASVVTVVGAFGANNYKNSLTGIKFEGSSNSAVNLVVQTKLAYDGNVTPIRKDANTYILMLPEMNSTASTPDLKEVASHIASVNIRTMPYSNTAKGYTRITIKTLNPSMTLAATNQVFIADKQNSAQNLNNNEYNYKTPDHYKKNVTKTTKQEVHQEYEYEYKKEHQKKIHKEPQEPVVKETPVSFTNSEIDPAAAFKKDLVTEEPNVDFNTSSKSENTYLWLWGLLIVLGAAFFYIRAKNKMQEIAGEKLEIDFSEEKTKTEEKKLKKIKNAINTLDTTYSKTASMPKKNEYTVLTDSTKNTKPVEDLNIVDLDELFQEHKSKISSKTKEEEENEALEEFLSGFSFDDTEEIQQEIEQNSFNEELYERIISNASLKFTQEDISCINQLLGAEIQDDTIRNIDKFAISNPIKPVKTVSVKNKILENIVTDYAISQNIIFSNEDIKILKKLVNVELDSDFIKDLRTNPQKTIQMEKDILAYGDKPKKPSEIVTLSVKNMLPDISKALKEQGNKKIESNYKADTIYFSEGYDVKTLSLNIEMPDLSKEINKKDAYASRPSAEIQIVDENYVVGDSELKISSELPDLSDILAHPDKYTEPEPKEIVVDAEALLNNISNVQFKPFYDGTNEFEVLNDLNDIPSMSEVQAELNMFEGFEVSEEEPFEQPIRSKNEKSFENNFVDLDNKKDNYSKPSIKDSESAEELIKKIETSKKERIARLAKHSEKEIAKINQNPEKASDVESIKCILEGETYTVVSSVILEGEKGCYLAKNENGYTILGYIGDKLVKIQHYKTLKSEKIHARLSEKLDNNTSRYLVRIGLQKFIVNVTENDINFVMDLC